FQAPSTIGRVMRRRSKIALAIAVGTAAFISSGAALLAPTAAGASISLPATLHKLLRGACALDLRAGFSRCNLSLLAELNGTPAAAAAPTGYGPADLQSAYALAA